jgi:hypothetical protein
MDFKQQRAKLFSAYKSKEPDLDEDDRLINRDGNPIIYDEWASIFNDKNRAYKLYLHLQKTIGPLTRKDNQLPVDWGYFMSNYTCDLSWAKNSQFCGGSGGNSSTELPNWAKCLKQYNPKKKNENVVSIVNAKGNTLYFSKSGKFQYVFTSKPGEPNQTGKWSCNGTQYLINMDNGDKWDGTKWISNNSSSTDNNNSNTGGSNNNDFPLEKGSYTTKGDPYQYKVVNGQWFVKSWKNRGKIINKWSSLKNNAKATEVLDKRHPGVRISIKSSQYQKQFNKMGADAQNLPKSIFGTNDKPQQPEVLSVNKPTQQPDEFSVKVNDAINSSDILNQ